MMLRRGLLLLLLFSSLFFFGCSDSGYDLAIDRPEWKTAPATNPPVNINNPNGLDSELPSEEVDETFIDSAPISKTLTITDGQPIQLLSSTEMGTFKASILFFEQNYVRPGEAKKKGILGVSITNPNEVGPFFATDQTQSLTGKVGKEEVWGLRDNRGTIVKPFLQTEFKGFNANPNETSIDVGLLDNGETGIRLTKTDGSFLVIPFAIKVELNNEKRKVFSFNGEKFTLFLNAVEKPVEVKANYQLNGRKWLIKSNPADASSILLTVQESFNDKAIKPNDSFEVDGVNYKVSKLNGTSSIFITTDVVMELFVGDVQNSSAAKTAAVAVANAHNGTYATNSVYGRLFLSNHKTYEVGKSLTNNQIEWSQPKLGLFNTKNKYEKTYYAVRYNPTNQTVWFVLEDKQSFRNKFGQAITLASIVTQDESSKQVLESKSYYYPTDEAFDQVGKQTGKETIAQLTVHEIYATSATTYNYTNQILQVNVNTQSGKLNQKNPGKNFDSKGGQVSWVLPLSPAGYGGGDIINPYSTINPFSNNGSQLIIKEGSAQIKLFDQPRKLTWIMQDKTATKSSQFTETFSLKSNSKLDTTSLFELVASVPANQFTYKSVINANEPPYIQAGSCIRLLGSDYQVVQVNEEQPRSITIDFSIPCSTST